MTTRRGGGARWVGVSSRLERPDLGRRLSAGTAADAKAMFAHFKELADGGAATTDLPGIGEGAVLRTTGLAAYQGGTYLQFTNWGLTKDQPIEIATLVVSRLQVGA